MTKEELFEKLIRTIEAAGIRYALTGSTESYPRNIGSDIDIVVPKSQLTLFRRVLWDIEDENTSIIQMFQHESVAFYYIIIHTLNGQNTYIQPDVCSDYLRNGRLLLSSDYLLDGVREASQGGFNVLAPAKEFIYYLLKKIDKKRISLDQYNHIRNRYLEDKNGAQLELKTFWGKQSDRELIVSSMENSDYDLVSRNVLYLRSAMHRTKRNSISDKLKDLRLKIRRIMYPTGLVVAVMGPDGVGKSAVIDKLKQELSPAFRKTQQFHLFPKPQKENPQINSAPHNQRKRNPIASFIKLCYLVLVYQFGFVRYILPAKIRSTFVIFDRYYDDIIIDPIRYRNGTTETTVRLLRCLIPTPDFYIFIDSPTAMIQSRKAEVTVEETERQRNAYIKMAKEIPNGIVVDNSTTLNEAVNKACDALVKVLSDRATKRYKI